MTNDEIDDWVAKNKQEYLDKFNKKFEDFRFDNVNNLDKRLAGLALLDTRLEESGVNSSSSIKAFLSEFSGKIKEYEFGSSYKNSFLKKSFILFIFS